MAGLQTVYGLGGGGTLFMLPPPIEFEFAPTSSQTNYAIGQIVYVGNPGSLAFYIYEGAGVWNEFVGGTSGITSVLGTTNQVNASLPVAGAVTLSIPNAFVAPGSISSTTAIQATTGLSIITGGAGLQVPVTLGSGAAPGPVTCKGRFGSATFTAVSIAAGASLTLTITNDQVRSSSTVVMYTLIGATTGAALTIQTVVNSVGSSAITITNGSGDTTQTDDITLNFMVLN